MVVSEARYVYRVVGNGYLGRCSRFIAVGVGCGAAGGLSPSSGGSSCRFIPKQISHAALPLKFLTLLYDIMKNGGHHRVREEILHHISTNTKQSGQQKHMKISDN